MDAVTQYSRRGGIHGKQLSLQVVCANQIFAVLN
jgi:hypothetical protein